MRKRAFVLVAIGLTAATVISGCSSSKKSPAGNTSAGSTPAGGSSSSAAGTATGACKLTSPPTSAAKAPSTSTPTGKATGKVGVILPDTTSSTRYTLYDKPLLQKALTDAGITADIQNAGGSISKFQSIAQSMIGEGVKVLIIDSIDAASGAAVEKQAATAGIKVIDYDRVNLGGSAQYYVSFDNEDVGRLQGQTLVDCLNADNVSNPNIIEMDGGTDVDNNAVLFAKGANAVLKPLQTAGKLTIKSESVVKGWLVANAAPAFQQALTAAGGQVQGVLAANDDIANAVIGVLKQSGLNGHVVVTGQDSGVEGLQNIITGQQSMTIFKNVKLEATAAAQLAIALIKGQTPSAAGLTLTKFADPKAPSHNLQALLLPSQVITQANVNDVIKAGALTAAQICKGITTDCAKLGIQ
ncbi:MAG: D-xylose transport system substrate-binding protein [Pseudonocardiales bacterium]|nr:D-xylose transport system substrate-binding protein [Pseudonocardiales bacterium]